MAQESQGRGRNKAHRRKPRAALHVGFALLTAGCAAAPPGAPPQGLPKPLFSLSDRPPRAIADAATPPALIAERIARWEAGERAAPSRPVEPAALPFLAGAGEERRFLRAAPARALARGDPESRCPGLGVVGGAPDPQAAAEAALSQCLASQRAAGVAEPCGCRLLAVDDRLLAPLSAFSRAVGVAAWIIGPAGLPRGPLVAEEAPLAEGARALRLVDAGGERARGLIDAAGRARLVFADGAAYAGRAISAGWRRGRRVEALRLTDAGGRAALVMIGADPLALAGDPAAP
jgi:hypothetical protein